MKKIVLVIICCGIGYMVMPGCNQQPPDAVEFVARANPTNVHRLTNLYLSFTRMNRGRGPKNEKVFKQFIGQVDPAQLERMGISPSAIEQLFMSQRDQQPLQVAYGRAIPASQPPRQKKPAAEGPASSQQRVMVVREAVGAEGKVMAGFLGSSSSVEEMSAAEVPAISQGV